MVFLRGFLQSEIPKALRFWLKNHADAREASFSLDDQTINIQSVYYIIGIADDIDICSWDLYSSVDWSFP